MEWIIDSLELTSASFEIVCIYSLNGKKSFGQYEVESVDSIQEIYQLEYDFILNATSTPEKMRIILEKLTDGERILEYRDYSERYLDGEIIMKCLKRQIERKRPDLAEVSDVIDIGDFTYGEPFVALDCKGIKLTIGKFCSISKGVMFLLGEDHRTDWNSTYPFNVKIPEFSYIKGHPHSKGDILIGNDVWIAAGATILSGVSIGDGCVIGAGAVVAHSVPAYSIVAGNPAQAVKKRFSEEYTRKLLEMQWWDWNYQDIYNVVPLLQSNDIESLYQYYIEHVGDI